MAKPTRNFRKRVTKLFRRQRKSAELIGAVADKNIDRLLLGRLNRLNVVRRFVSLWLVLFVLIFVLGVSQIRGLGSFYQSSRPVPGGIYNEGIVGLFDGANPLYANGAADTAVSQLIFSGLFKYDVSDKLVGDLATSWRVDARQTTYTIQLRHGITWQDGAPFTSADVVFTYQTIQNPEAQSPLFNSWQGINVSADGPYAVQFSLPNPLNSFLYNLTNGIVPAHLLKNTPAAQLRSDIFNVSPIGTGPFEWRFVTNSGTSENRRQQITLAPFNKYWAGAPKLAGMNLVVFGGEQQMINSFKAKNINAMAGLDQLPANLTGDTSLRTYNTPLNQLVMAFFNNSNPILANQDVRLALTAGVNRQQLLALFDWPPNLASGPLLPSQMSQIGGKGEVKYNLAQAKSWLDAAGWKMSKSGLRAKGGKTLQLQLVSQNTPAYQAVAQFLQEQWAKLGVKVVVNDLDVNDLQGSAIPDREYDILLYGISIGVNPDVFAYWDSSQASASSQGHLNLSEYKSSAADQALEAARTRPSLSLQIPKYQSFLATWRNDAPALSLYQPNFLYVTRGPVYGYAQTAINSAADRFGNVDNWMIRESSQSN